MFEAHMFLILGITILSLLSILSLIRAGPFLLLLADYRFWILVLVTVTGWILVVLGINRFMRAALDLETSRGVPPPPTGDNLYQLQRLRTNRRRILLTRVLPIGLFFGLLVIVVLWS
jgi:hypothetical protein